MNPNDLRKLLKSSQQYAELENKKKILNAWIAIRDEKFTIAKDHLKYLGKGSIGVTMSEIYYPKAFIEYFQKNYFQAIKYCDEGINLASYQDNAETLSSIHNLKGTSLFNLFKKYDSEKSFKKAIQIFSNDIENYFYLASISAYKDKQDDFDYYMNEIISRFDSDEEDHRDTLNDFLTEKTKYFNEDEWYQKFLAYLKRNELISEHTFYTKSGKTQNENKSSQSIQILELIKENRIGEALDKVLLATKNNAPQFNSAMLLFNNYNKIKMEIRNGIVGKDDENIILNKIKLQLLELLNEI